MQCHQKSGTCTCLVDGICLLALQLSYAMLSFWYAQWAFIKKGLMHALAILCEFKVINIIMNMHNKTELSWFLACLVFHSHTCDLSIQSSSTFFSIHILFYFSTAGKILFELFVHKCPKTAENFRSLCIGDKGNGPATGKTLHFKGSTFHRSRLKEEGLPIVIQCHFE